MAMWLRRLYGWACERLYAELAWSYDWVSWLVSFGQWANWRALALDYVHGERTLEIGFGTGELLPGLAQQTNLTIGLELSSAMHVQTMRKLIHPSLMLPRVQARAQAMPFAEGTFDTILATFPAPYILQPTTLQECVRLLARPTSAQCGGRLVIVGLWVALSGERWARCIPFFYGQPSLEAQQRLIQLLQDAGLRATLEERTVGFARVAVVVAEHSRENTV